MKLLLSAGISVIMLLHSPLVFSQVLSGSQIDSLAKNVLTKFQVPGLAIGIIKDGKLIYSKGFGMRSLQTQQPVNPQTLFGIASNTKAFTAAALGILVDKGKLNWDDKVIKYLPEFQLYDAWATKEMTIRDLLSHRSGIATGAGDLMHDPDSTDFTVKDIIHNLRYLKPVYSFRSKFAYDNNLYLVAGEIIARISKMNWEDFIEQRILRPLQMNESSASFIGCKNNPNKIDAHNKIDSSVRVVTRYTATKDDAAGGIYSNIEDMSKWLLMFLNKGKYGKNLEKQLLSEQAVQELCSPQTIIPVSKGGVYHTHFGAYGLGWFMVDVKGYKQVFHTGEDVGMVSEVSIIPEIGLGVIVLTNSESNAIDALTDQITDSYLGITGTDRANEAFTRLSASENSAKKLKAKVWMKVKSNKEGSSLFAKKYVGVYHDRWFGNVTITMKQNRLWFAAQRSRQLKGFLFPYQNNTFVFKWQNPEIDADTFVIFKPETKTNASFITLKSVSPGMSYNFDDLLFQKIKEY